MTTLFVLDKWTSAYHRLSTLHMSHQDEPSDRPRDHITLRKYCTIVLRSITVLYSPYYVYIGVNMPCFGLFQTHYSTVLQQSKRTIGRARMDTLDQRQLTINMRTVLLQSWGKVYYTTTVEEQDTGHHCVGERWRYSSNMVCLYRTEHRTHTAQSPT